MILGFLGCVNMAEPDGSAISELYGIPIKNLVNLNRGPVVVGLAGYRPKKPALEVLAFFIGHRLGAVADNILIKILGIDVGLTLGRNALKIGIIIP